MRLRLTPSPPAPGLLLGPAAVVAAPRVLRARVGQGRHAARRRGRAAAVGAGRDLRSRLAVLRSKNGARARRGRSEKSKNARTRREGLCEFWRGGVGGRGAAEGGAAKQRHKRAGSFARLLWGGAT